MSSVQAAGFCQKVTKISKRTGSARRRTSLLQKHSSRESRRKHNYFQPVFFFNGFGGFKPFEWKNTDNISTLRCSCRVGLSFASSTIVDHSFLEALTRHTLITVRIDKETMLSRWGVQRTSTDPSFAKQSLTSVYLKVFGKQSWFVLLRISKSILLMVFGSEFIRK